ncbi:hypothetical protein [Sulfuricurvum sp.]|uniref:hypothetical protein n=1 Tax=Sulfuricurvum sp. TaxID=2025608 RepID=UPI003BB50E90
MNEAVDVEVKNNEPFYKKYIIHLSVAAAVIVVGVSAFSHYKNERVKGELIKALSEYQDSLVLMGGEMKYDSIDCSGIISTDCEIEALKFSMLGQEQLSIGSLRLGDVESLSEFKAFSKGESVKASFDIEADEVALPKPIIAQMIAQNVSNAFQQNTLSKLSSINFAFKGEVEGNQMHLKHLEIDQFRLDNAIMPLEFSMSARDVSSSAPDSMILEEFALSMENRAIGDVTYESVKSFVDSLQEEEKGIFLKEFALTPADMSDRKKASVAINNAIAKRFEADLPATSGIVEKELIRAMVKMLKGQTDTIVLEGKNQNDLTMVKIQSALQQSSTMSEEEAAKYMSDKFKIEVKAD